MAEKGRKKRKVITKETVGTFIRMLNRRETVEKIMDILDLSRATVFRLIGRNASGEFSDLSRFRSVSEKMMGMKRDRTGQEKAVKDLLEENNGSGCF